MHCDSWCITDWRKWTFLNPKSKYLITARSEYLWFYRRQINSKWGGVGVGGGGGGWGVEMIISVTWWKMYNPILFVEMLTAIAIYQLIWLPQRYLHILCHKSASHPLS